MRTLLVDGHIYAVSERFATALLVEDGLIAWIGTDAGAHVHMGEVDAVVELSGDLLAPGFVHLADAAPPSSGGFTHGDCGTVSIADRWDEAEWDSASTEALAVVPADPCRLRSRISAGVPTALVPAHDHTSGWQAVRAAVHEVAPAERITARAAFSALTRGAWRLLGEPDRGVLAVGSEASFVQWAIDDLVVETPDERISNWSTDPRSATPGLPPLGPGDDVPIVRRVWHAGAPG
ncbi:MAG: amidohydrolase family protein [Micrococcales bacterium]|nr:amidohydrolase family protein [Micrococcales bacterium]